MKKGLEPAFPVKEYAETANMSVDYKGMSQRLYLAGMALQGLLSNSYYAEQRSKSNDGVTDETLCNRCFDVADELLRQYYENNKDA